MKIILITGCSSGIGKTLALELKKEGHRVFATARKKEDIAALQSEGLEVFPLELSDINSINQLVKTILEKTPRLDVLINNAAYAQPGAVEDLSFELLEKQFRANVFGTIALTNQFIPLFRQQKSGRIINISSILGVISLAYRGAYNASKYALEGFTDTLRLELHGSGVKVCLIEPGAVQTCFRDNAYDSFIKNLADKPSVHQENYQRMIKEYEKFGAKAPFMQEPTDVLKKVRHAINSKYPKIRYPVGLAAAGLRFLKRILPDILLDKVLLKISADELKK